MVAGRSDKGTKQSDAMIATDEPVFSSDRGPGQGRSS